MVYLLFPGRHIALTEFQRKYLTKIIKEGLHGQLDVNKKPLAMGQKVNGIIWAITSANHSNTRRNPIPTDKRIEAIVTFTREFENMGVQSYIYGIDDVGATGRFADYCVKKIEVQSEGLLKLTPKNTVVVCSTPSVIALYKKLGFHILPAELTDLKKIKFCAPRPWDIVLAIVRSGQQGMDWRKEKVYVKNAADATKKIFEKYKLGDKIIEIHSDPLLSSEGDITETRNYNTYSRAFESSAQRKYDLIKKFLLPGRIVDIGCGPGALIKLLAENDNLRESDIYGIEAARALFEECTYRKNRGDFANENVFFYQRNILSGTIFARNSINTFITMALTHEIFSYQGKEKLKKLMSQIYSQLAHGSRWINVDVVGPENKNEIVYMKLNKKDGRNTDWNKKFPASQQNKLKSYLDGMSTFAKFLRFETDFRTAEREKAKYKFIKMGGTEYVKIKLEDACEFLSKKDYTDNWYSELHERFCFFSYSDWKKLYEQSGFRIIEDRANVENGSREIKNNWIIENRWKNAVELFRKFGSKLTKIDYPVTNVIIVAEKPL